MNNHPNEKQILDAAANRAPVQPRRYGPLAVRERSEQEEVDLQWHIEANEKRAKERHRRMVEQDRVLTRWTDEEYGRLKPGWDPDGAEDFHAWLALRRKVKDTGRQRVYDAESQYSQRVRDALKSPTGEVTFDGATYRPEPVPRLWSEFEAQEYINELIRTLHRDRRDYDGMEKIMVRIVMLSSRGSTAQYDSLIRAIRLPGVNRFTMNPETLQHELSHHLSDNMPRETERPHGTRFRSTFIRMLRETGMPERSRLLRASFLSAGLDVDDAFIDRR